MSTNERLQSLGEEIANAISHGFGVVSILAATPFLLVAAFDRGGALAVTCASIFAATAVLLYLSSTLYHALRPCRAKSICNPDCSAICTAIGFAEVAVIHRADDTARPAIEQNIR